MDAKPILIVDIDTDLPDKLKDVLQGYGYKPYFAATYTEGLKLAWEEKPRVVLLDPNLPDGSGARFVSDLKELNPECACIMMTTQACLDARADALERGALFYLLKPVRPAEMRLLIERAFEITSLREEKRQAEEALRARNQELEGITTRLYSIVESTEGLATSPSSLGLGPLLLEEFARNLAAGGGSLFLREADGLILAHSLDPGHAPATIALPLREGTVFEQSMRECKPLLIQDIEQERDIAPSGWTGYGDGSLLVFPLPDETGQITGIISLHDRTPPPFTRQDLKLGSILASHSSATLRTMRAEEALSESRSVLQEMQQYLGGLIESSADAIIVTDWDGRVALFNWGAEALSGYQREEVIGQRAPVLYENEKDAREVMRRMRKGDGTVSAFETTFRAKDGSIIPVLISASILYDEDGREIGTVGFSKDLREVKRAEEKLRQAHEELQQAYDAMEQTQEKLVRSEKLGALGRLTAGVSHEILNPLNIITMALQLMIENPDTPAAITRQLRILDGQSNRIAKIAQDLVYFARQRPPERRRIDFNETVKRTLSLVEHDLKLSNIAVEINLLDELPPVYADQDQLQQVILNLLTNARDAMPEGGRLTLGTDTAQDDVENYVELRVEDTGSGIEAEHLDKLFDPFFTTKAEGEGTGLGLSICQGIIAAHGGEIRAENIPGGGAAFVVLLSLEER